MNRLFTISSRLLFFTLLFIGISCTSQDDTSKKYVKEVNKWHAQRIASLEKEDSWLSLVGLYELKEGSQTIGSDSTNDIVFPPQTPAQIGTITKNGSSISIDVTPSIKVIHDSTEVSKMKLSVGETELRHDNFLWYVIERRDHFYIRLKDNNHPNFNSFNGIERFPVSSDWRVKAMFKAFDEPKAITIPDVLNEGLQDSLYGMLEFTIDESKYSLAPLNHPKKAKEFFIIFGDKTNGASTYGGGRYMYIPTPDKNGVTYLDFNKSYNPPCVFSEFATCPLPPPQNRLPIKVTAGEKMWKEAY